MGTKHSAPIDPEDNPVDNVDDEYGMASLEKFKNIDISPEPLWDVGHGTIRYRGRHGGQKSQNGIGFGFIYHPKLHDVKFNGQATDFTFVKNRNLTEKRIFYCLKPGQVAATPCINTKYIPAGRASTAIHKRIYQLTIEPDGNVDEEDFDDGMIELCDGHSLLVSVSMSLTVDDLKGMVSAKTLYPIRDIELIYEVQRLYGDGMLLQHMDCRNTRAVVRVSKRVT